MKLPKLGMVRARISRPLEGRVLSATVKRTPTYKYFVTICCTDCPRPDIPKGPINVLGVDAGTYYLMARSDGAAVANPEKKLAREQRRLSRKKKDSRRRARQRMKVARIHERVANQRKDAPHKATPAALRESQAIAVEDLDVKGREQNCRLAKSAADASMSEMIRQLE